MTMATWESMTREERIEWVRRNVRVGKGGELAIIALMARIAYDRKMEGRK
jgi:hypothetical protein